MKLGPLDDLPRTLTAEAAMDKQIWIVSMIGLKGRERREAIARFISRYGEVPHIPDVSASSSTSIKA